MSRAQLYGLAIEADYDLNDVGDSFEGRPDVRIRTGAPFSRWPELPPGTTLLDFATANDHWYVLVRAEDGTLVLRIPTLCDFVIAPDLTEVEVWVHEDAPPGMDAVLTSGALLSALLFLRGTPVFHGSAVERDGSAIAFVGHSGQGKTTMATAFCAEGAAAVTDDVLVIDHSAKRRPTVRRGSRELRLRSGTAELLGADDAAVVRTTVDERRIVTPRHTAHDNPPLRAIVIPRPRRDGSPLSFERLSAKDATLALLAFPRLMGWRDPEVLGHYFAAVTKVTADVPVLVGNIPWGPPFATDLYETLHRTLAVE